MTARCFVDANVFVYARDPRDTAKHARAVHWLALLWRERSGRTSTQVLAEYYVIITRKLSPQIPPDDAWDDIRELLSWRPQPVDADLLLRARQLESRYRLPWWDTLVVAAAQLQDCALLLSENLQDGAVFGTVTVRSPFTLEFGQPAAVYASRPVAAPLHRPRGRPKRAHAAA